MDKSKGARTSKASTGALQPHKRRHLLTYRATQIYLTASSLGAAIPPQEIRPKRSKDDLDSGNPLRQTLIPPFDDELSLHFLGSHQDKPFFLTRVSQDLIEDESSTPRQAEGMPLRSTSLNPLPENLWNDISAASLSKSRPDTSNPISSTLQNAPQDGTDMASSSSKVDEKVCTTTQNEWRQTLHKIQLTLTSVRLRANRRHSHTLASDASDGSHTQHTPIGKDV